MKTKYILLLIALVIVASLVLIPATTVCAKPRCVWVQVQCIKAPCDPILVCKGDAGYPDHHNHGHNRNDR